MFQITGSTDYLSIELDFYKAFYINKIRELVEIPVTLVLVNLLILLTNAQKLLSTNYALYLSLSVVMSFVVDNESVIWVNEQRFFLNNSMKRYKFTQKWMKTLSK